MEKFLNFFETMPLTYRLAWIIICLMMCWILEGIIPLFQFHYKKVKHVAVNFFFLFTTMIINTVFGIATVGIFSWISVNNFGLLNWVDWPIWIELIIAILFFELVAQYTIHFILHRVKWMWKMHMIHHSDTHLDVSSGTRHHPGDFVTRELFALLAIFITGVPASVYLFYRILTVLFTYFTHANIELPTWLDKALSFVFVTPNMHKFHHHFERPWTDSNFGNMFSIWDRLFGTFVYDNPKKIRYGLDVLEDSKDENISFQIGIPFNKNIKTDY